MRVSTQMEVIRNISCMACHMDEDAPAGARCECHEEECHLEVVGDVELTEAGEEVRILSILDLDEQQTWTLGDLDSLETQHAEDLLSEAAHAKPEWALLQRAAELASLLKTHVQLAVESGTSREKVSSYLEGVSSVVLYRLRKEVA